MCPSPNPPLPLPLQLEWLSLCAMERNGVFVFGTDCIPDTWQQLRRLKALELRWACSFYRALHSKFFL